MNPPDPNPPLPPDLDSLIARTVKRARLRRSERDDVTRELRSHFVEAIADGTPIEDVVGGFGDPDAAGRLIGRAKRRCRGLAWHAWVWSCRSVAALFALVLVTYAWAAMQYYRPSHVPIGPYEDRMFEAMGWGPEHKGDAWKQIRAFAHAIPDDWTARRDALPDADEWSDSDWADAGDLIAQVRPLLDAVLPALRAESLGYTGEDWTRDAKSEAPGRDNMFLTAAYPMLNEQIATFRWLAFDLEFSQQVGDVERALQLAESFAEIGRFIDAMTLVISQQMGSSIAARIAGWILQETSFHGVDRIPDVAALVETLNRLRDLAETYAVDAELISIENFLANLYGGTKSSRRVSAPGWMATLGDEGIFGKEDSAPWWWPGSLMNTPAAPALSLAMPTFGQSLAHVQEFFRQRETYCNTPLWIEYAGELRDPTINQEEPWETYRHYTHGLILPAIAMGRHRRAWALIQIDAALTSLAISEYQRDHGAPPPNLEALVPKYLPHLPIDQFTGKPLQYRITVEGPVLYSTGVDRDDDGGLPIVDEKGRISFPWLIDPGNWAQRDAEYQAQMDGDWILWPVCACPDTPVWSYADPAK